MKRCKYSQCREPFTPKFRSTEECCSTEHAIAYARETAPERLERQKQRAVRAERREIVVAKREGRAKTMSLSKLTNLAQREFNKFIRERDFGQPCICCGNYGTSDPLSGGVYDAGHYRTRGAAPQLRFNEDNCHLQLKNCNMGNASAGSNYRARLVEKIGLARVDALENNNSPRKWTRDELVQIRRTYLAKWKQLKRARESGRPVLHLAHDRGRVSAATEALLREATP